MPRAARGTSRERVGVEQVVAAAQRQVPALLFLGPEAGIVQVPAPLVGRQKARQEAGHVLRVLAHDGLQLLEFRSAGGCGIQSAHGIQIRFVGDVLVQGAARLLLAQQKR